MTQLSREGLTTAQLKYKKVLMDYHHSWIQTSKINHLLQYHHLLPQNFFSDNCFFSSVLYVCTLFHFISNIMIKQVTFCSLFSSVHISSLDCSSLSSSGCRLQFDTQEASQHYLTVTTAGNTSVQFAVSVKLRGNNMSV